MKNKNPKTVALTIGGFLVMIAGLALEKNLPDIQAWRRFSLTSLRETTDRSHFGF